MQTPTVEDVLSAKVYVPQFITKLAELGVTIGDEGDLQAAIEIAQRVRMHKQASGLPQGTQAPATSLLKEAAYGLSQAFESPADVAAGYMQDPLVQQALATAMAPA